MVDRISGLIIPLYERILESIWQWEQQYLKSEWGEACWPLSFLHSASRNPLLNDFGKFPCLCHHCSWGRGDVGYTWGSSFMLLGTRCGARARASAIEPLSGIEMCDRYEFLWLNNWVNTPTSWRSSSKAPMVTTACWGADISDDSSWGIEWPLERWGWFGVNELVGGRHDRVFTMALVALSTDGATDAVKNCT